MQKTAIFASCCGGGGELGFLLIRQGEAERSFFLEVDRSSEPHLRITDRIECYLDFYRRGGLALRGGHRKDDYREIPFRVLAIFRNAERRSNAAERLIVHQPPILSIAVLTTVDELRTNPLGSIWIRPLDYRDAVGGTPFRQLLRQSTLQFTGDGPNVTGGLKRRSPGTP
ncbi:MAG: hypothetical protein ABSD28_00715 [Tepidisphaeraceae bacterium]